jgi:predicted ribosomally synthesized peptide with nif11-like leader
MSVTTAQQFLQAVESDHTLQEKLRSLAHGMGKGALDEVVRIAASDGYVFTRGELEAALKQHLALQKPIGQLSEADLELIAGGKQRSEEGWPAAKEKTSGGFWGSLLGTRPWS